MESENPVTSIQQENSKRKLLRKVLSIARGIITYEVGLSVGVSELIKHLTWLRQSGVTFDLAVLTEYETQIRPIPFGRERLNCSREALRRYDEALLSINSAFHDRIIDACFALIEEFGKHETTRIRN